MLPAVARKTMFAIVIHVTKKLLASSCQLLAILLIASGVASAAWYGPVSSPAFCTRPTNPNGPYLPNPCSLPLNASTMIGQIRTGPLTIFGGDLWVKGVGNSLTITDGQVGIGRYFGLLSSDPDYKPLDSTALLDVDGQVRIADGTQFAGRTLRTDNQGFAYWGTPLAASITSLIAGTGIILTPTNPITGGAGTVSIDSAVTQKRISGTCNSASAFRGINQDGINNTCQQFVTGVTASNGVGANTLGGGVTNLGLKLVTNSGLSFGSANDPNPRFYVSLQNPVFRVVATSSAGQLKLKDCTVSAPYLKWDGGSWNCGNIILTRTGESVMYLRSANSSTVPPCPTTSGWDVIPTLGSEYSREPPFAAAPTSIRTCYRRDNNLCQVLELKAPLPGTPTSCPTGASPAWSLIPGGSEYAYGWNYINNINVCYRCVAP